MHGRITRYVAALALVGAGLAAADTPSNATTSTAPAAQPQNGRLYFTSALVLPPLRDSASGGQIWSVNADGSGLRQLTHQPDRAFTGSPAVSPDGRTVAFVSTRGNGGDLALWLMNASGSHKRQVLATPHTNYYTPAWSPDGSSLLLTSCDTDLGEQDCPLVTVRPDGTGLTTLLSNRRVNFAATYSPDGTRVQYTSDEQGLLSAVWLMNSDGSAPAQVTDAAFQGLVADWSPDGSRMVLSDHCCQPHSNLYSIRPDGSGLTKLTHVPYGRDAFSVDHSPDGASIAYADIGIDGATASLVVADAAGHHPHAIVGGDAGGPAVAFAPSWGIVPATAGPGAPAGVPAYAEVPDFDAVPGTLGRSPTPTVDGRIAYTDSDRGTIITVNPDGSAPIEVTSPGLGFAPFSAWTPDGQELIVSVLPGDFSREQLYVVAPDGSAATLLLPEPEGVYDYDPEVTPDGRWIVFTRYDAAVDGNALFAVRTTGGRVHHVTPYSRGSDDSFAGFHTVSRDGTHLAYQLGNADGIEDQIVVGDFSPRARLTDAAPITTAVQEAFPYAWSADGQYVLGTNFNRHLGESVAGFPVGGGTPLELGTVPYPGELYEPSQSPTGAVLAYIRSDDGFNVAWDLVVANPDGSNVTQVPTSSQHPIHVQWGTAPLLSSSIAASLAAAHPAQPAMSATHLAHLRAGLPAAVRASLDR